MNKSAKKTGSIKEECCAEIGNMAVCLFYLSQHAERNNLLEVSRSINQSITQVISIGAEMYQEQLKGLFTHKENNEQIFIEQFCPANNKEIKIILQSLTIKK